MKKLLFISLVTLTSISFGQLKSTPLKTVPTAEEGEKTVKKVSEDVLKARNTINNVLDNKKDYENLIQKIKSYQEEHPEENDKINSLLFLLTSNGFMLSDQEYR